MRRLIAPALAGRVESGELATLSDKPEWSLSWRHQAIERVVQRAIQLQTTGKHFLLCGDPVPPGELLAAPSAGGLNKIAVCLLDISKDAQVQRLTARGDAPDLLPRHLAFAEWMRQHAADHRHRPEVITNNGGWEQMRWATWTSSACVDTPWRCHVIDTSHLPPQAIADQVLLWIEGHLQSAPRGANAPR